MDTKVFINDWLYHHAPAFRYNDQEFINNLEDYRRDLFRKIVEDASSKMILRRRDMIKEVKKPACVTTESKLPAKGIEQPKLSSESKMEEKSKKRAEKYIPVVVTELVNNSQPKKKVSFPKEKIEYVMYVDKSIDTQKVSDILQVVPDKTQTPEISECKEEEDEEERLEKREIKVIKFKKESWQYHVKKLRALLKLLVDHKNDGLSDFTKFLRRHHITNHFTIKKLSPEKLSAEKFIVEQLLGIQRDLERLRESSKNLEHPKKMKRKKIRRRIIELSDGIMSGVQSCLHDTGSVILLDPKNLYYRLQRIERMYATLYNTEFVTFLSESNFGSECKKKVALKKHKVAVKQEEEPLTSSVVAPKVRCLKECKSDLISILKTDSNIPSKSISMPSLPGRSYSELLISGEAELKEEAVNLLLVEIESLFIKKLNMLSNFDKVIQETTLSQKYLQLRTINNSWSVEAPPLLRGSTDVDSLFEAWDSVELLKEKRQCHKLSRDDYTEPNFNEKLSLLDDSLLVISKRLKVPLKHHKVTPKIHTAPVSNTDLTVCISRASAEIDLLDVKKRESETSHKRKTKSIEHSKKMGRHYRKATSQQRSKVRWVP